MVGVLAGTGIVPVSKTSFEQALRQIMPERLIEPNMRALDVGYRFGAQLPASIRQHSTRTEAQD
jgi:Pyruvate/2-oxoacid:ferredoxin oxidoreductase gamma subunit